MIPVVWLVNHPECWDQALIDDILSGRSWPTGFDFEHHVGLDRLEGLSGAVVVIPGANQAANAEAISAALGRLSWALALVTSDEERRYPLETLRRHSHVSLWLQYPREDDQADFYLPVGYPPHFCEQLDGHVYNKPRRWVWAGQVNHERRRTLASALEALSDGLSVETPGFGLGLDWDAYALALARSQFAPCPSGPHSVDTFRVAEALEAVCLPIVDSRTPVEGATLDHLWARAYPGAPFPSVHDWSDLPAVFDELADDWPRNGARAGAWWLDHKRRLAAHLGETVSLLSGIESTPDSVTVLIPTSPIESHPSTEIIETTIASVRFWHPEADILIMCDGVRSEQEHYRSRYEEYLERLVWLAARDGRISVTIHGVHRHQAEMTRRTLDGVTTPLILFVEHDTPLVTDEQIDWLGLFRVMLSGYADVIRFHYEAHVQPEHAHLMLDREPRDVLGVPLLRTVQWSQRPHLANTAFYRRILARNFPSDYKAMIEDVMHGRVHNDWREFGLAGWDRYLLWMYAPEGNIKRSLHLDGRGADRKWEFG